MPRITPWLDRTRVLYVLLAVALAVVGWRLAGAGDGGDRTGAESAPVVQVRAATASPEAAEPPRVVHVTGAVRRPGVFRLPAGARAGDAVRRAGGPTRHARLQDVNLAAPVADGQQIVVPDRRTPVGRRAADASSGVPSGPVSLSTATADELEALDGIGPTLAARIVEWRERNGGFGSVDDLLEVPGIGESRLDALRDHVVP